MTAPFVFNTNEVRTTASFGIVLSPIGDITSADVLQNANIAMHRAKEAGRNRFKVFTERMLESAVAQLSLENDMRSGLESGQFRVEFQPIMDLGGSDLMGFEALARWDHPSRGLVPPSEFIPLAEECGLILPLGEWVLKESLRTLAEWRKNVSGAGHIYISVNLSTKQFARMELDKLILDALDEAGLPPSALKLEITESAIMDHPRVRRPHPEKAAQARHPLLHRRFRHRILLPVPAPAAARGHSQGGPLLHLAHEDRPGKHGDRPGSHRPWLTPWTWRWWPRAWRSRTRSVP